MFEDMRRRWHRTGALPVKRLVCLCLFVCLGLAMCGGKVDGPAAGAGCYALAVGDCKKAKDCRWYNRIACYARPPIPHDTCGPKVGCAADTDCAPDERCAEFEVLAPIVDLVESCRSSCTPAEPCWLYANNGVTIFVRLCWNRAELM